MSMSYKRAGSEDQDPVRGISLRPLDDDREENPASEDHEMHSTQTAPPSYASAIETSPPPYTSVLETSLDDVEASEEEQQKLLDFYKRRKQMEDDEKRRSQENDGTRQRRKPGGAEEVHKDSPKHQENQEKLRKFVRDLRRDCSVPDSDNEVELEMMNVDNDSSYSERPRSQDAARGEGDGDAKRVAPLADLGEVELAFVDTYDASATIRRQSLVEAVNGSAPDESSVERAEPQPKKKKKARKLDFPEIPILYPILAYAYRVWPTFSTTKKLLIILIVLAFIGLILFVSLFPASFVYVEYHEYAFAKHKITEKVYYDDLYQAGCYVLSPAYEMVRFKATAHFVDKTFVIMNKEGMDLKLHIMLQYFLKLSQVEQLYRKYNFKYEEVIDSLVESTTKNTAVKISIDEYRLARKYVEAELLQQIRYVLSGDCCEPCCPSDCGISVNCTTCRPEGQCKFGHYVELRYFQMGEVWIPDEVMNRFLRKVIFREDAERELYRQAKAVEEKITEQEVKRVNNAAEEVRQKASAESKVITVKAEAERYRDVQKAYQTALKGMFSRLNITSEDKKCSLMFVRALEDMKDNLYTYDYDKFSAMSDS